MVLVFVIKSFSQDTSKLEFKIDTLIFTDEQIYFPTIITAITHSPSKADSTFYRKHSKLITVEPTKKNHSDYYFLACALWELNRLVEAEEIFLKIMDSQEPYFADTYYHSSDIPGDKSTNSYGYGSYSSNYKNGESNQL